MGYQDEINLKIMGQILCPHCGNIAVTKTTKGTVTRAAAQFGGGFVEGATKALADGFLFEGAGRLVPKFGNNVASLLSIEHICKACDCLFKATLYPDGEVKEISLKKLPVPESIIEKEKAQYIQDLRASRPYTATVILALISLYCIVYMFIGVANESGVQIVLSFFFAIPFIIPAIIKWNKINTINREIENCEDMDLREFKHSHRDIFSKYTQYN